MNEIRLILISIVFLSYAYSSFAHESRPAYLEINETEVGSYDIVWKRPMRGDRVLGLHPKFPSHCRQTTPTATYNSPGASLERQSLDCGKIGLVGKTIRIDGLSTTLTDVLARVGRLIDEGFVEKDGPVPVNPSGGRVACGHIAGVSSVFSIGEVAMQLRREAGDRQVPIHAGRGLVSTVGGPAALHERMNPALGDRKPSDELREPPDQTPYSL